MKTYRFSFVAAALFLSIGCSGSSQPQADQCGDVRTDYEVFYGTIEPTYVPLTPGQILAIGDFSFCSGTLIGPTWVLSAKHCQLGPGDQFCMGEDPNNADVCFTVAQAYPHPDAQNDLALAELTEDVRERLPQVEPIPIMNEIMGPEWVGQMAEAAGYGQTEVNTYGTRFFTAEPIYDISGNLITVNGEGVHGLCGGDSGGPVLIIAPDNSVRVAGALFFGDNSCVDLDSYSRTDVNTEWIEGYVGPTIVDPAGCGSIDDVGYCSGPDTAIYCAGNDELSLEPCEGGATCGWDDAAGGFRCITGADPCDGFSLRGGCDGDTAYWCDYGVIRSRDCASCGEICEPNAFAGGAYCMVDPCAGLDYLGRCNGAVAEWCDEGVFYSYDCATENAECGYIDDEIGYYCL